MATDIEVERLVVLIEARTKQFEGQLKKLEGKTTQSSARMSRGFKQLDSSIASAGKRFLTSFGTGLLAGFLSTRSISQIKAIISEIANLGETAQKAGVSIADLQRLTFAGISTGVSEDDITRGLAKFNKFLGESVLRGGGLARFFEANGIALRDQNGQLKSSVDLFVQIGDLVKNAANDMDRQVILTGLLGRSGAEMTAFFMQGSDAIRGMMKEADAAGAVIDDRIVGAADEFYDNWAKRIGAWASMFKGKIAEIGTTFGNMFTRIEDRSLAALEISAKRVEDNIASLESGFIGKLLPGFLKEDNIRLQKKELAEIVALIAKLRQAERDARKSDLGPIKSTVVSEDFFNTSAETASKADAQADATKRVIEALRFEQDQLGRTSIEQRIQNELRAAGIDLTTVQGQKIAALVTAIENEKAATEAAKKAAEEWNDVLREASDTLAGGINAAMAEFVSGSGKAKDAFSAFARSVLSDLSSIASKMFSTNLFNLFAGAFGGGGGGGGMGLKFGGLYAGGGTLGAGQWGIAGESGPEIVRGPASITPISGGAAGGSFTFAPVTTINGSNAAEIQSMLDQRDRQLADQFRQSIVPAVRHGVRRGKL